MCANAFLSYWVFAYGKPGYVVTDCSNQFLSDFFAALGVSIGTTHITTTSCHRQTNVRPKRYNPTLLARFSQYISQHQTNWDLYVQSLTYAYNTKVRRSTDTPPSDLTLTRHPPDNIITAAATAAPHDVKIPDSRTLHQDVLNRLYLMSITADARTELEHASYKRYLNRKIRFHKTFRDDDQVFVERPPGYVRTKHERAAGLPKSMVAPKAVVHCTVILPSPTTVKIREEGVDFTISSDGCTAAHSAVPLPPVVPEVQQSDAVDVTTRAAIPLLESIESRLVT